MVGVTWTDPALHVPGAIEVRTRLVESGQWSRWLRLDGDSGQGESGAARGGTEPAWVGPSDGIEARVRAGSAHARWPRPARAGRGPRAMRKDRGA
ncbi:N-acetylmuramoyl-L-alanine amidase, partial [Streptomyces sp. NPDC088922]